MRMQYCSRFVALLAPGLFLAACSSKQPMPMELTLTTPEPVPDARLTVLHSKGKSALKTIAEVTPGEARTFYISPELPKKSQLVFQLYSGQTILRSDGFSVDKFPEGRTFEWLTVKRVEALPQEPEATIDEQP